MKASDYRIGNLAMYNDKMIVLELADLVAMTAQENAGKEHPYKPLPISTEICINHLDMVGHHNGCYNDMFCLTPVKSGGWKIAYYPKALGSAHGIRGAVTRLDYIHQVQNIIQGLSLTDVVCQL